VSTDQEGGIVARVLEPATQFPGNMALGAARDPALANTAAAITGHRTLRTIYQPQRNISHVFGADACRTRYGKGVGRATQSTELPLAPGSKFHPGK
jgi:Glycosyl hydrolase family 3 N terminal domain